MEAVVERLVEPIVAVAAAVGDLAARLAAIYDYMVGRLLEANLHSDPEALDEIERLLGTLRDAWVAIDPEAPGRSRPAGPAMLAGGRVAA